MSTMNLTAGFRGRVTQRHVLRSEWTKLWSLRSTRWTLLAAVLGLAAPGIIVAADAMHRWAGLGADDRASFDSIDVSVGGWRLAQLAVGLLGVLVISGEYSTGMIRSSLIAVPRRLPVLAGKLGVYGVVTLVAMLVSAFTSFFVVQAIVSGHDLDHGLGDPHALRVVVGTALFLTVLGAFGLGLGALVRNTAGGIGTFVGLLFVLPGITALLPHKTADAIGPYLPLNAGTTVATSTFEDAHHLAPWTGFAVFCGYTAVILVAAGVQLVRRDA